MEHATIPKSPIDLAGHIRELLEAISNGRKKLRSTEAQVIFKAWRDTNESWELACNRLTDLTSRVSPSPEEIAEQNESKKKLEKPHVESWHKVQELRSFIDSFGVSVEVLLSRIPNRRRWLRFAALIRCLRFRSVDDWIQPNTDLDTLEMRLGEMLALTIPRGTAGVNHAGPAEETRLTPRLRKIEEVILLKRGPNVFQDHDNPWIIRETFQAVRNELKPSPLTKDAFRAAITRIRQARRHPSSADIRKRRSSN